MTKKNIHREWKSTAEETRGFNRQKSRDEYVPAHKRPGFKKSKIIKLKAAWE